MPISPLRAIMAWRDTGSSKAGKAPVHGMSELGNPAHVCPTTGMLASSCGVTAKKEVDHKGARGKQAVSHQVMLRIIGPVDMFVMRVHCTVLTGTASTSQTPVILKPLPHGVHPTLLPSCWTLVYH